MVLGEVALTANCMIVLVFGPKPGVVCTGVWLLPEKPVEDRRAAGNGEPAVVVKDDFPGEP